MKKMWLQQHIHRLPVRAWESFRKVKALCGHKFLSLSVAISTAMLISTSAFASTGTSTGGGKDIWQWLTEALADLYGKFVSISTIAACVAASICLLMMNFSTDDRAVSSARSWLKRILISWVVLNVLGFIMAYLVPLTSGGQYVLPGGNP